MSHLPLANITTAVAVQDGNRLVVYLSGTTDGFGGRFALYHPSWRIYPPAFIAYEITGNCGINPDACPQDVPTQGAFGFDGHFREIQLSTASGKQIIEVMPVGIGSLGVADAGGVQMLQDMPLQLLGDEQDPQRSPMVDRGDPFPFARFALSTGKTPWYAWHNRQPGSPQKLHLIGVLMMPTSGFTYTIKEAAPQGINPRQLILELELKRPEGMQIQVITPLPVNWEKQTDAHYDSILIRLPSGKADVVPVEEVS